MLAHFHSTNRTTPFIVHVIDFFSVIIRNEPTIGGISPPLVIVLVVDNNSSEEPMANGVECVFVIAEDGVVW